MNYSDEFDSSDYQLAIEELLRNGELNIQNENYQAAIEDYTRLLQLNPNESQAYWHRGLAWLELGNYQESIKDCTQYLKLRPDFIQGYIARAGQFKDIGNLQRAIEDCTYALSLGGLSSYWEQMAYSCRGDCYALLKNYQAALQDYNQSIRLAPEEIKNYQKRGLIHKELENYHEAIEDLTKVLRRNSEDSELVHCYHLRAQCHQILRNWEEAIRDSTEVIRRDPTYYHAYILRGGAYVFLNDRKSAVSDFETAARLSQAQGDTEAYQNVMMLMKFPGSTQSSSDSDISNNKQRPVPVSHVVAAIFFPPLGVYLTVGLGTQFWINLVLTFVFTWIPGMIHAVWLVYNHDRS
ncbi:tetratricopeptide repeat protein [Microcoleus sp. N9_B2]|uniref:YqaE/Pmp3 family membrane protein n=1 Tax=unclassified Microcoleus TaxID=2642155 RepID=UPI002FD0799E